MFALVFAISSIYSMERLVSVWFYFCFCFSSSFCLFCCFVFLFFCMQYIIFALNSQSNYFFILNHHYQIGSRIICSIWQCNLDGWSPIPERVTGCWMFKYHSDCLVASGTRFYFTALHVLHPQRVVDSKWLCFVRNVARKLWWWSSQLQLHARPRVYVYLCCHWHWIDAKCLQLLLLPGPLPLPLCSSVSVLYSLMWKIWMRFKMCLHKFLLQKMKFAFGVNETRQILEWMPKRGREREGRGGKKKKRNKIKYKNRDQSNVRVHKCV